MASIVHDSFQSDDTKVQEMRRPSLRLLPSLRRSRTSEITAVVEDTNSFETSTPSHGPDLFDREIWHRQLGQFTDVSQYLETGSPLIWAHRLESLTQITSVHLGKYGVSASQLANQYDEILDVLIRENSEGDSLIRDVAILSCLGALSMTEVVRHLLSLRNLDEARYFRLLVLAGRIRPDAISSEEKAITGTLLRILSDKANDVEELCRLIEIFNTSPRLMLVPVEIMQRALTRSGIGLRLQERTESCLKERKLMSAFHSVSWLPNFHGIAYNSEITALLDLYFPLWPCLAAWRPDVSRITRWERGNFTDEQRQKLSHVFDLEGPDIATHRHISLMMSDPQCFTHVRVLPRNLSTLETLLDLLDRAQIVGPNAVDLFVDLCIENEANEAARSTVDDGVQTDDDSYCGSLLSILRTFRSQASLAGQMNSLTQVLPRFKENIQIQSQSLGYRVACVMQSAQQKFCSLLETGTGEILGLRIHDLANAILKAPSIHSDLPASLLTQLRSLPPRITFETIFDRLQDDAQSSGTADARFKSYLAVALGGRSETGAGAMTQAAMQDEVVFWSHPPDSLRQDFARMLENIRSMSYSQYTECLLVVLNEDDMYIREMRSMITLENQNACIDFTTYLIRRRKLDQLQHNCWLALLESLFKEQNASSLEKIAKLMPSDQWFRFAQDITFLFGPANSTLPEFGSALSRERLQWWLILSKHTNSIRFLLEKQGIGQNLTWLYFPTSTNHVKEFLDILEQDNINPIHREIVSYLKPDGDNLAVVCSCIRSMKQASITGQAVLERILLRASSNSVVKGAGGSMYETNTLLEVWQQSKLLSPADKLGLDSLRKLMGFNGSSRRKGIDCKLMIGKLMSEYSVIISRAEKLEKERLRLRQEKPAQITALLERLGVDNTTGGRPSDFRISNELAHAVETVGKSEYELSFPLTGLSDLHRRARGLPQDSRVLIVRLCLLESPKFCIHFAPGDEGRSPHNLWQPSPVQSPDATICSAKPSMFSYYLSRHLNHILQNWNFSMPGGFPSSNNPFTSREISLDFFYSAIQKLITESPSTCLVCCGQMSAKLWKPSACSKVCSTNLRKAPLEVRLHNLLVDPLAMDLILTAVYEASADLTKLKLLPGCPVQKNRIRAVIDSFPPLASLQTSTNFSAAIRGLDEYGKEREDLLSWVCLKFRGLMLSAPENFRVPSMPGTQQFLLMNSSHEREKLFATNVTSRGSSGVVFHGTQISRLFLILTEGLKSMSGTPFMAHGNSGGAGVYCGDDQTMSLGYSGNTGQSWKNSALSNMRVMLGCELATYTSPVSGSYHVVTNHNSLLVRYVFLLPPTYQPPPRHHVEPAMKSAFSYLQSGLLS